MKCYRIRKKHNLLNEYELAWMQEENQTDYYVSSLYETLKGAKSALSNNTGYFHRVNKADFEIVEFDLIESQVF
jgi:hypothetical protein